MAARPHPLDQVEIRFGIAGALLVAVLVVSGLARLEDRLVLGGLLVATAALAATVNRGLAAVLGLTAWALATGFVTNAYGVLTFAGPDLELMAALVLGAVLTSHLTGLLITARARCYRAPGGQLARASTSERDLRVERGGPPSRRTAGGRYPRTRFRNSTVDS